MYYATLYVLFASVTVLFGLRIDPGSPPVHNQAVCNIDVCFAVQGSDIISPNEFQNQTAVVRNVVNFLHGRVGLQRFAAVQYAIINSPISPLTDNRDQFLQELYASRQSEEMGSFPTAGLNYCFSELHDDLKGQRVIVFFGNGISTIGSEPTDRATLFRQTGGKVISVGVGKLRDQKELKRIAGNADDRVFSLGGRYVWVQSLDIVNLICPS